MAGSSYPFYSGVAKEAVGWGAKIVETEVAFWSDRSHFPQLFDGLHGLGGLAVFHFLVVFYDLLNWYAELIDFQRSVFSVVLDLMLSEPAPFQLFDETW